LHESALQQRVSVLPRIPLAQWRAHLESTIMAVNELRVGMQVIVRDGSPEPPLRFVRKHEEWSNRNYNGVLVQVCAVGGCSVQMGDFRNRHIIMLRHGVPVGRIRPNLERPEILPIKQLGAQPTVDVDTWLAEQRGAA